jgi:DUF1009 family protein
MPTPPSKLGIIAGSGNFPERLIAAALGEDREIFVIAFDGETDMPSITAVPHAWVHLGHIGHAIRILQQEGISEIVLAGKVRRPSLPSLRFDIQGLKLVSRIIKSQLYGDNAIFSTIVSFLEDSGFTVIGADSIFKELLAPEGVLGMLMPDDDNLRDIEIGARAASLVGSLDIGQAVIVQNSIVLGVEAIEGTDALMQRCAHLKREGRGGVLVKMKKPMQESRIDLPAIGVTTIINAHAAGLSGIAVEAEGAIIIDRQAVIDKANELGLFVIGIAGDN